MKLQRHQVFQSSQSQFSIGYSSAAVGYSDFPYFLEECGEYFVLVGSEQVVVRFAVALQSVGRMALVAMLLGVEDKVNDYTRPVIWQVRRNPI